MLGLVVAVIAEGVLGLWVGVDALQFKFLKTTDAPRGLRGVRPVDRDGANRLPSG
jgi:hypothetical protein